MTWECDEFVPDVPVENTPLDFRLLPEVESTGIYNSSFLDPRRESPTGNADFQRAVKNAYDQGLAALITDLHKRERDKDVLVVAMGEFGRTPRVNKTAGRDHWGNVMSVLMAGGGLKMGQVIGSSSAKGEAPKDNPYRPENVLATVYRHLGIDTEATFADLVDR